MKRSDIEVTPVEISEDIRAALETILVVALRADDGDPRCLAVMAEWAQVLARHMSGWEADRLATPIQGNRDN